MKKSSLMQLIVLAMMVLILSTACAAPQLSPTPIPPTPIPPTSPPVSLPTEVPIEGYPSARAAISLVYDVESDRFIMFGGQSGSYEQEASFNNETWSYDVTANKWTQMKSASAPSAALT
jgi:hypothetical protein